MPLRLDAFCRVFAAAHRAAFLELLPFANKVGKGSELNTHARSARFPSRGVHPVFWTAS